MKKRTRHILLIFISVVFSTYAIAQSVNGVAIYGSSTILALKGTGVYKSTDAGLHFIQEPGVSLIDIGTAICINDNGYGFIVGNNGMAYRITPGTTANTFVFTLVPSDADITNDQGSGIPVSNLISVSFTDNNTGYMTLTGGMVLKTTDGGFHWKTKQSGGASSAIIAFGSKTTGTFVD